MFWQACLDKNILLLLFVSFISYHYALAMTAPQTTPASSAKLLKPMRYTPNGNKNKQRNYGNGNVDGYYGNSGDYDYYRQIGVDGIDPRRIGTDIGDFGPVYSDQPPMLASMDIFIRYADDWESDLKYGGKGGYGGKNNYRKNDKKGSYSGGNYGGKDNYKNNDKKGSYSGGNYGGTDNYKNNDKKGSYPRGNYGGKDNYKNNDKKGSYSRGNYGGKKSYKKNDKKGSYSRVRFPVRRYPDAKKFPVDRFPPLISIFPWLPIFYDRITYQTIIFSPTGGIYIIPPVINFYGERFAVAQLIKWGYASLVSSGAPPPPGVNIAPLVQPGPI